MSICVLVADDHAIIRRGLIDIISETLDIHVAGEASSSAEVFDCLRSKTTFDVLVLDLNLGQDSGLEVLKSARAEFDDLAVLILSVFPEKQFAIRVLKAGASGYLNKDSAPEKLVDAIRRVAEGRRYVSPAIAEDLLNRLDYDGPIHGKLSDREFQVLRLLAAGNTVSEIGEMLSLSVKTISTYRSRLLEKMEMKTQAELTHYAIKNNLII